MKPVRGVSITEYLDKKHLNMHERLDLFLQVCDPIQHTHQKGIIHRDIKPDNVMVTPNEGKPLPLFRVKRWITRASELHQNLHQRGTVSLRYRLGYLTVSFISSYVAFINHLTARVYRTGHRSFGIDPRLVRGCGGFLVCVKNCALV